MIDIRVMGLDLKPARSGIAMNYAPDTGGQMLQVQCVGRGLVPLHQQIRTVERAIMARVGAVKPDVKPDVVFVEATFSKGRQSDYGQLAVHFAVTHILWSLHIPWVDVTTGKVKMWATGSGSQRGATKVTKDKVIAGVIAAYGHLMNIPAGDDDACDAVALMTMAAAAYGHAYADLPKTHTRALKELVLPPLEQGR